MFKTDPQPLPAVFEYEILPLLFKEASTVIKTVFSDTFEGSPYFPMLLREIRKKQIRYRAGNIAYIRYLKKNHSELFTEEYLQYLSKKDTSKLLEEYYLEEIISGILPSPYFLFVDSIVDIFWNLDLNYNQVPVKFHGLPTISNSIHHAAFKQKIILKDIANHSMASHFTVPQFTKGTKTKMIMKLLEVLDLPMDTWYYNQEQLASGAADMKKSIKKINRLNKALHQHYDPYGAVTGNKSEKEIKLHIKIEEEVEELDAALMFFHFPLEDPCSTLMAYKKHYGDWPMGYPYSLKDFGVDLETCD